MRRILTPLAILAMAMSVAVPAWANDTTTDTTVPPPEPLTPTEVVSTMPLFGAGVTLTVSLDGAGALSSVAIDPTDGLTETDSGDHHVLFVSADGETKVVVKSMGNFVQTKVKSTALTDVLGPGTWSADVFGTGLVTVDYEITADGNDPVVTVGSVTVPDGVEAKVGDPVNWSKDPFAGSRAVVTFVDQNGRKAMLSISAARFTRDGEDRVSVKVSFVGSQWMPWGCWGGRGQWPDTAVAPGFHRWTQRDGWGDKTQTDGTDAKASGGMWGSKVGFHGPGNGQTGGFGWGSPGGHGR